MHPNFQIPGEKDLLQPMIKSLSNEHTDEVDDLDVIEGSFFDYLQNKGLKYDLETIENYLLSIKAKQFIILSGGTGTGKTKLAKTYGEFISHQESKLVDFNITIGKGVENGGYTLSRDTFFNNLPPNAKKYMGVYKFIIAGIEGTASIELQPRFWFNKNDPNMDLIDQKMKELNEVNKRTKLQLIFPKSNIGSKNYSVIPVGSNWNDNRHIIGYKNAITGQYNCTDSLNVIIKSNNYPLEPFHLILDEMNLSHVERYFSDIISCMESGEPISLDVEDNCEVPNSISIEDNLFIIGTVNMDETTYMFSPKVLDRANVLEFNPTSASTYLTEQTIYYDPKGDVEFLQNCMNGLECRSMSSKDIILEFDIPENTEFINSLINDLENIQKILTSMKFSFGFRTMDEIMRFMYVSWIYERKGKFVNWKRYFDSQIKQKILPKIHGNSSILNQLKELKKFCQNAGYIRSTSKLEKMISVLESQRYVSFNC